MLIKPIIYTTTRPSKGKYWFADVFPRIYRTVTRAKNLFIDGFVVEQYKSPDEVPLYTYQKKSGRTGKMKTYTRFTWDWFVEQFTDRAKDQGYNCIIFHTTPYHVKKWGLKGFNGLYRTDTDDYIEIFVVADNDEDFWRLVSHEIGHFAERRDGGDNKNTPTIGCNMVYDSEVHKSDYCDNDLDAFFARRDMTRFTINIITKQLMAILAQLQNMLKKRAVYPLAKETFLNRVSQGFGVRNSWYRSGIHNGTDWAVPAGTPIYAPYDGEVYSIYAWHSSMGNALYFKFQDGDGDTYYMRCLHLVKPPVKGVFKKGDVIGHTGNTGFGTGPHLHLEIARKHIDNNVLSSEANVRKYMVDPFRFFRLKVDNYIV